MTLQNMTAATEKSSVTQKWQ